MKTGVWALLFKLLVLQYLMDINGKMWLRNPCHLYVIEILEGHTPLPKTSSKRVRVTGHYSITLGGAFDTFWGSPTFAFVKQLSAGLVKKIEPLNLLFLMSGVKILRVVS